MKYRSDIDGLRAVAVVPVVLFHAGLPFFGGGFVGVDVFFVISGFLISSIIFRELNENRFSISNFYLRRARRILPALFFVMLCCLPIAWFLLTPSDLKAFGQSYLGTVTFSSNILFWLTSGYFAATSELNPMLHTWTLAVEEQFYVIFPIMALIFWKSRLSLFLVVLLVFLFSISLAQWGSSNFPTANFYLLPFRAWELFIGVMAAMYLRKYGFSTNHKLNQSLSIFGLILIFSSIFLFDDATPFPSIYALPLMQSLLQSIQYKLGVRCSAHPPTDNPNGLCYLVD